MANVWCLFNSGALQFICIDVGRFCFRCMISIFMLWSRCCVLSIQRIVLDLWLMLVPHNAHVGECLSHVQWLPLMTRPCTCTPWGTGKKCILETVLHLKPCQTTTTTTTTASSSTTCWWNLRHTGGRTMSCCEDMYLGLQDTRSFC